MRGAPVESEKILFWRRKFFLGNHSPKYFMCDTYFNTEFNSVLEYNNHKPYKRVLNGF